MGAASRYCFRQPGATLPTLVFAQSYWALQQRDESIERSLELACEAGDVYLEAGLSAERIPVLRRLLDEFPLKLIAQGWATDADDAIPFLDRAVELGACCINFHLGHAYLDIAAAVRLIETTRGRAERMGLPFLLETHRGRLTQDLLRTVEVLRHLPGLPVTLDISHYIVAGEGMGGDAAVFGRMMTELASRTAMVHGRISDGQSVQVRSDDALALTNEIAGVWRSAMESWLAEAPADAVFVFEPELGPPPYAPRRVGMEETYCRTEESAALMQLAQKEWSVASRNFAASQHFADDRRMPEVAA